MAAESPPKGSEVFGHVVVAVEGSQGGPGAKGRPEDKQWTAEDGRGGGAMETYLVPRKEILPRSPHGIWPA